MSNVRAVHEHEGLRGDRRVDPVSLADEWFGSVEKLHRWDQFTALDEEVDTAALTPFIKRAFAVHCLVKLPADCQQGVANHFAIEAPRVESPKELVAQVLGRLGRDVLGVLPPGGAGQDEFVHGLQLPIVLDQAESQPVEQLGMGGWLGLGAEIVRRGHEPVAEVMLPQTVHYDAGRNVAGSILDIGQPSAQGSPPVGGADTCGSWDLPMRRVLSIANEKGQEGLRNRLAFFVRVSAAQKKHLLVEMGISAPVRMVLDRLVAFAGHHHLDFFQVGLPVFVGGDLGAQLLPFRVNFAVGAAQGGPFLLVKSLHATGLTHCLEQGGHHRVLVSRLQGRSQLGGNREAGSPNDVAGIDEIIQLEGEFGATLVFHRFGELEHADMILADLTVHCPTRLALVLVDGGSDGEVGPVLLVVGSRIDQLDGFALSLFAGFLDEHADVAEGNVSVASPTWPVVFHRLVGQRLDAECGHLG